MQVFQWTLALLVLAVALTGLARRWHLPYPALLALLGAALVFVPGTPRLALDPALALALFVAPVLLDAAFDTAPRELLQQWKPITGLVLAAVAVTVLAVAATVHWIAGLPWAAAVALGAIVAPPDAAAATTVLKQARPPYRDVQILQGESLLNDASALLTYRIAVAVAMGETVSVGHAAPMLLLSVAGSLVVGIALARGALWLLRRMDDAPSSIVMQFATTFGVWLLAEHAHLSGILTVVAYAMTIARKSPAFTPARLRIPSYAVWETVVFVLNALAFVLIGLQLGPILERLSAAEWRTYSMVALATLAVVIVTRMAWVGLYTAVARWRGGDDRHAPSVKGAMVVAWCGMRGIVTLAAALALPDGEHPFPGRELVLVTAFAVVLGTLILQGLTLGPLITALKLRGDRTVDDEAALARRAALKAALHRLKGDESPAALALREEYLQLWREPAPGTADGATPGERVSELRRQTVGSAREALAGLRQSGRIGDDAFHLVEHELDHAELYAEATSRLSTVRPTGA